MISRRRRLAPPVRHRRDATHASVASRRRVDGTDRHEHAVTALYNAGYLGANVCAQNDDRDGSNRCKKILEAANDLEVSRVLLDKALKALGENPSTDQIRSALGMENVAVSSRPAPWWDAQIMIPVSGMLLGNATTAVGLSLNTIVTCLVERRAEIELYLAFGATKYEATLPFIREAVRVGFMPILNQMLIIGVVSIPGMMTGQIL